MDVNLVIKRFDQMKSGRANFDRLWSDIASKLWPDADEFITKFPSGTLNNQQQYDSFPMLALSKFAAAISSGLTPRTSKWHLLTSGYPEVDRLPTVSRYLESLNQKIWRARYIPKANWEGQSHEAYLGLGAFGNGIVFIDDHPEGGLRYRSMPLNQCYMAEDASGTIDTVYREFEMTSRQMRQVFGEGLPEKIEAALKAGKLDETFTVLHCVQPREDYKSWRLDNTGMKFTNDYIMLDGKHILREGGFYEFPYAIARYLTKSREVYGRGPGTMLISDIKMVNEMKRTIIEVADMAADPPTLLRDDGILGEFRLMPGSRNYGGIDENGRPAAIPFQTGADHRLSFEILRETKSQIDDGFLGVYFRVLLENPNMTATQALLLAQQQGQMTNPTLGRLQTDFLGRAIKRESGILFRQGRHPEAVPPELAEALQRDGESLAIEYDSPMTRASRAEESIAILRSFEALAPMAQIDPTVFRRLDPDKVSRLVFEVNGVPASVIRSDEEIEQLEEQEAQQQMAAAALQAAPVAAQTIESLARAQQATSSAPKVMP